MLANQPGPEKAFKASCILIIPFSELGTKSAATRKKMMDQLLTNVKHVLKHVAKVEWTKFRAKPERLVFFFKPEQASVALEWLQKVPGILRLHPSMETSTDPVQIRKHLVKLSTNERILVNEETTEIKVIGVQDKDQREKNMRNTLLGHANLACTSMENDTQDKHVYIEIHEDFSYISLDAVRGMNGSPVGTQNPVVVEIIGRQGDVIAAVLAAKRGIVITPIFYDINEFTTNQRLYNDFMVYASKIIGEFHGFPVKKTISIRLDSLLRSIDREFPETSKESPCACCLIARRVIASDVVKRLSMTPFIVQGVSENAPGELSQTCPIEGSLHAANLAGLYSLHPLVPPSRPIDDIARQFLSESPVPIPGNTFSWDFCTRRTMQDAGIVTKEHVDEITAFVNEWAKKEVKISSEP